MTCDTMRGRVQLNIQQCNASTAGKIAGHLLRIGELLDEGTQERGAPRINGRYATVDN